MIVAETVKRSVATMFNTCNQVKYIIFSLLLLASNYCHSQTITNLQGNQRGTNKALGALKADSVQYIPVRPLTTWPYASPAIPNMALIQASPADTLPYYMRSPGKWSRILLSSDTPSLYQNISLSNSDSLAISHGNTIWLPYIRKADSTTWWVTKTQLADSTDSIRALLTGGTVTSVTAGAGLSASPNPITTSGTISMPNIGTPGTYGGASSIPIVTTDAQGRAMTITTTNPSVATVTGTLSVSNGGTSASTTTSVNGTPVTYGINNSLPIGTGTVTNVIGGTNVSITGTSTVQPTVNISGTIGTSNGGTGATTATSVNATPLTYGANNALSVGSVTNVIAGTNVSITGTSTIQPTVNISGTIGTGNGGTGSTTTTSINATPISYGTNNVLPIGTGTVTNVIGGTNVSITGTSTIQPTVNISGTIGTGNGGTGSTTTTSINATPITYGANNALTIGSGTVTNVIGGTNISITGTSTIQPTVNITGTIGTGNGGTGATTTTSINTTPITYGANTTIAAAAGTLTGSSLAAGVTSSSLTSFGSSIALGTPASGNLSNCTNYSANSLAGSTLNSGITGSSLTSIGSLTSLTMGTSQSVASATSAKLDIVAMPVNTVTVTGTVNITTATGFNAISIYRPTYTDASAVTISNGASLYIDNAPAAAGSVTLTTPYALNVNAGNARFGGHMIMEGVTSAGATGTGNIVFAISPSFTTPILGTPTSGTFTNCTGLPISTGVSGLGSNVATALATFSSANIATACTDKTGTAGALVFSASPALSGTPTVPTASVGTNTTQAASTAFVGLQDKIGNTNITSASSGINTTETVIVKTPALSASRIVAGTAIKITWHGTCTSTAANTSTFGVRFGTNGTTADGLLATATTSTAALSGTSIDFVATMVITLRTVGSSTTATGYFTMTNNGITGISTTTSQTLPISVTSINTTTASAIISATYKSAASTTTSTFQDALIELLNL